MSFKDNINTWIFYLDNTLYSADSGIFQQVHKLMGEFVAKNLNMELAEAKKLVSEQNLSHAKVAVTDIDGILRGKYISKEKLTDAMENGFGFCDVILGCLLYTSPSPRDS